MEIINNDVTENINVYPGRFYYQKLFKGKYTIKSQKDFLVSKPLYIKGHLKNKKIIISLFIDGLPKYEFLKEYLNNNFNSILKNSINFKNHYSLSEWTLPSFATIMTGLPAIRHGYVMPRKLYLGEKKFKFLSEYFRENDFLTTHITSNWRCGLGNNYFEGFDKTLFSRNFTASDICQEMINHLEVFGENNNFLFMNISDIHHMIYPVNLIKTNHLNYNYLSYMRNNHITFAKKSVNELYSQEKKNDVLSSFKSIELNLLNIINYIKHKYHNDEYLIALMTDHGHSFLDEKEENYLLKSSRIETPFYIISNFIKNQEISSLTDNSDIMKILLNLSGIEKDLNDQIIPGCLPEELGGKSKKYVRAESIYPNQKYLTRIIGKDLDYRFSTNNLTQSNGIINHQTFSDELSLKDSNLNYNKKYFSKIILNDLEKYNNSLI